MRLQVSYLRTFEIVKRSRDYPDWSGVIFVLKQIGWCSVTNSFKARNRVFGPKNEYSSEFHSYIEDPFKEVEYNSRKLI